MVDNLQYIIMYFIVRNFCGKKFFIRNIRLVVIKFAHLIITIITSLA